MKKFFSVPFFTLVLAAPFFAFAQSTVTIQPTIPGMTLVGASTTSPAFFVAGFYNFALMIGGVLAFGAIVWGGILYASSAGNSGKQSEGKEWIKSALLGLLLLAGAYLILYTVNPNLVNLGLPKLQSISIENIVVSSASPATGSPLSGGGGVDANALQDLHNAGIVIDNSTVNVTGLLNATVQDAEALKSLCGCNVDVTSGTDSHAAGTTHAMGYNLDIATNSALNNFITSQPVYGTWQGGAVPGATLYKITASDGTVFTIADERNIPGEGPHWHLSSSPGH
jgi:hypothetical protein